MNFQLSTWLYWGLCAAAIFWALGAYNRLIRLRAQHVLALQQLIQRWQMHAQMVRTALGAVSHSPQSEADWVYLHDDARPWMALAEATKQLMLCIAGMQTRASQPLANDSLCAVWLARETMLGAWLQLQASHDDLAGAAVPQPMRQQWQEQDILSLEKQKLYNECAQMYNHAIAQFPAWIIAWIFSFKPVALLQTTQRSVGTVELNLLKP